MQKGKWLFEDTLQVAEKRREVKGKGENERYKHLNAEFQRIARRDKKAFLSEQYKETGKQQKGKAQRSLQENQRHQGTIYAKMGTIKDRNGRDLTEAEDIKKKWQNTQKNYTVKIFMTQITMMV